MVGSTLRYCLGTGSRRHRARGRPSERLPSSRGSRGRMAEGREAPGDSPGLARVLRTRHPGAFPGTTKLPRGSKTQDIRGSGGFCVWKGDAGTLFAQVVRAEGFRRARERHERDRLDDQPPTDAQGHTTRPSGWPILTVDSAARSGSQRTARGPKSTITVEPMLKRPISSPRASATGSSPGRG